MRFLLLVLCVPLLLVGCAQKEEGDNGEAIGTQKVIRAMPTPGRMEDAKRGRELWFAYGAMEGTESTPANGVAKAHFFENQTFLHTVELNIAVPEKGSFYEGWLVQEGRAEDLISTGHLKNTFGDTRHHLIFETQRDLRDALKVVVTLERDDGDPSPGKVVGEGMLKVVER